MRKCLLFLLILSGLVFYSCSSHFDGYVPENDDIVEEYDVVFSVSGFQQEITPLRGTGESITGKYVAYWVYVKEGVIDDYEYIYTHTEFTPENFDGQIRLRLPKGNYRIAVFASDKPIGGLIRERYVSDALPWSAFKFDYTGISYADIKTDIFHGMLEFSVTEQSVSQEINLSRPITKINLALNDLNKIPSSIEWVVPVIYSNIDSDADEREVFGYGDMIRPHGFYLDGRSMFTPGRGDVFHKLAIKRADLPAYGKDNPITFYFPQNQNFKETSHFLTNEFDLFLVGVSDANLHPDSLSRYSVDFSRRLKKNIQLLPNQSITLSGYLFNNEGLSLSIDDTWGEITENEF